MSYIKLEERTTSDTNASADINQLQENLNVLKGGVSTDAPVTDLTKVLAYLQVLTKKDIDTLTVKPNVTNYNTQLDIAFNGLRVEDKYLTSVTATIDITVNLDTGIEAISTWYYVWCFVAEDNSYTFKFSASATAPTVPSGYTRKRLISYVYNKADGHFRGFHQQDKFVTYNIGVATANYLTLVEGASSASEVEYSITLAVDIPEGVNTFLNSVFVTGAAGFIHLKTWVAGAWNIQEYFLYTSVAGQPGANLSITTFERKLIVWGSATLKYIRVIGFTANI